MEIFFLASTFLSNSINRSSSSFLVAIPTFITINLSLKILGLFQVLCQAISHSPVSLRLLQHSSSLWLPMSLQRGSIWATSLAMVRKHFCELLLLNCFVLNASTTLYPIVSEVFWRKHLNFRLPIPATGLEDSIACLIQVLIIANSSSHLFSDQGRYPGSFCQRWHWHYYRSKAHERLRFH